jgi:hypothetical protein
MPEIVRVADRTEQPPGVAGFAVQVGGDARVRLADGQGAGFVVHVGWPRSEES